MAARLRKGDHVILRSGKDKGRRGFIVKVIPNEDKVIVGGINLVKRHIRPSVQYPQGGIFRKEAPIHVSKVMPIDPKTGQGTRVRFSTNEDGKKIRIAVRSGEPLVATPAQGDLR
ncbi:50S ribosomal protein L24 [Pajaroellobacter abortibovis]|nr:50S ribosomal protein L24 [Pajaroellobacter abortibovis]